MICLRVRRDSVKRHVQDDEDCLQFEQKTIVILLGPS